MASQEETTGATAMSEDEFDGLDDPNDIFDDMPPLDVARDTLLLDLQATPPATQSQPRRRRERELTDDDGSDDNDGGNVEEGQGDRMSDYPLENSAVASQPQAQSQPLPQGLPVLPVMPLVSRSEASPTGVVNVTSAQIRSEIQGIRSACRRADLIIERSQQLHDELEHLRAMTEADDADNFELDAFDFGSRLQLVLGELEDVDIEDVPNAAGFAEREIVAEVDDTRDKLRTAIQRTRAEIDRMEAAQTARRFADAKLPEEDNDLGVSLELLQKFAKAFDDGEPRGARYADLDSAAPLRGATVADVPPHPQATQAREAREAEGATATPMSQDADGAACALPPRTNSTMVEGAAMDGVVI